MNKDLRKKLIHNYTNPSHPSFLKTNKQEIYNDLHHKEFDYDVTHNQIQNFLTETDRSTSVA